MNQKEIFDKLFILGFVWITPMSFVGILRSSLMWVLVNGVEVNIPICRNYDESVASNTSEEEEERTESQDQEEEEVQSKSQESQEEEESPRRGGEPRGRGGPIKEPRRGGGPIEEPRRGGKYATKRNNY